MYGMATYVDMHIDKATGPLAGLQEWMKDKDEFQKQVHFETGKHESEVKVIEEKLAHFDELDHQRDERIIELEKKAAASEVSRRAIGDYVKEHAAKPHQ
jgi:DNA polymerase III sliding clamp (beta) subunit (PCNA family)